MHPITLSKTASSTPIRPDHVFSGLSMVGTFRILGWVLGDASYELDLTDESFYPVWISNPFICDASITQFGFIYHPPYRLLGGDPVALRQANIPVTFLLSWALIDSVLKNALLEVPTASTFGWVLIDMTGRSPGILYLLNAENIGQTWTMGGYPGSLNLAIAALRRVPCEKFATAWLLQEEKDPGRSSPDLISHFGGHVENDYQEAARRTTPSGAGDHRSYAQTLMRITRNTSPATDACERARQSGGTA